MCARAPPPRRNRRKSATWHPDPLTPLKNIHAEWRCVGSLGLSRCHVQHRPQAPEFECSRRLRGCGAAVAPAAPYGCRGTNSATTRPVCGDAGNGDQATVSGTDALCSQEQGSDSSWQRDTCQQLLHTLDFGFVQPRAVSSTWISATFTHRWTVGLSLVAR